MNRIIQFKTLTLLVVFFLSVGLVDSSIRNAGAAEPDSAEYKLTFTSVWSAQTHPQSFPSNPHFSGLIGGTHNNQVAFWEVGSLASNGIESMAETGSKTALQNEVNAAINAGKALSVISGGGIPNSPGSRSVNFTVTQSYPLATVVTMIAPSPDWFVGVSGTNLFQGGKWVDELVISLQPFDSGTDSGTNYTSPNNNTNPADPIFEIMGFPFLNNGIVQPLGTFTFKRIVEPTLISDNASISAAVGGTANFDLMAGFANANREYLVLGSISGTDPGLPLPGGDCVLPINWDTFTSFMLGLLNTGVFQNFVGTLDNQGEASAQLNLSPVPASGFTMHYAYLLKGAPWDFVSNSIAIDIVP